MILALWTQIKVMMQDIFQNAYTLSITITNLLLSLNKHFCRHQKIDENLYVKKSVRSWLMLICSMEKTGLQCFASFQLQACNVLMKNIMWFTKIRKGGNSPNKNGPMHKTEAKNLPAIQFYEYNDYKSPLQFIFRKLVLGPDPKPTF